MDLDEVALPRKFPVGLRVLVVDDDVTCLMIVQRMLENCHYIVTTSSLATRALSILRENKTDFDLVLSDVHMPDMDGFRLLELIGLEMDLPVIMMSSDKRTEMVMEGIKHGACDYLTKPVRMEELQNIWQHVMRKKIFGNKDQDQSGSVEDSDRPRRDGDEGENTSSVNEGNESEWRASGRKRELKEEEVECQNESEEPAASKKPRVVWSVELHQQFVNAIHQLGIDKAVPKRILEIMNVPGLTRENVASHLQKFRLYMKRLSVTQPPPVAVPIPRGGRPADQIGSAGPVNCLDFPSLTASSQLSPQALAALHAEMLGQSQPLVNIIAPPIDQSTVNHTRLSMMETGGGFGGFGVPQVGPTPMLNVLSNQMQVNGLTSAYQTGVDPCAADDLLMQFQAFPGVDQRSSVLQPMGYGHIMQNESGYVGHVAAPGYAPPLSQGSLGFVGREMCIPSRFAGDEFEVQAYGVNPLSQARPAWPGPSPN